MNSYLPHYDRRGHNKSIMKLTGGAIDITENIPLPILEEPKPNELPLMKEVERLFEEIQKFPVKDPSKDNSRKNVLQKKNQKIEAMVLGKVRSYSEKDLVIGRATKSGKFDELEAVLKKLVKLHNPNFRYTSIQINKSVETAWHFDKGNVGLSYCIAFGKYVGGGVVVKVRDNKEMLAKNNKKWLFYDGHSLEHKSAPVKSGIRYAVIFFTKR